MPAPDGVAPRIGRDRWNHNIEYGLELAERAPLTARDVLDVGCGEGWLARELSRRFDHVVGLDPDEASITVARASDETEKVDYLAGELLTYPFEPTSFDFIACVATLHHMDEEAGLRRMAELLRPGGTLAVVGLARSRTPVDVAWDVAGAVSTRIHRITKTYWETSAPKVWPPPHSYGELRAIAREVLPGSTFRRRPLWRYVLTWTKPAG